MIDLVALLAGALLWLGYWCGVSFVLCGLWWVALTIADRRPLSGGADDP